MSEATWDGGIPLTKSENAELRRLNGKHRDIRLFGAAVLEKLREKQELQRRRQAFVDRHAIGCFKCGATATVWVAGGKKNGRAWVLCQPCVRKPKGAA